MGEEEEMILLLVEGGGEERERMKDLVLRTLLALFDLWGTYFKPKIW